MKDLILAESRFLSNLIQLQYKFGYLNRSIVSSRLTGPDLNNLRRATMKKFVIERKIDGVGRLNDRELSNAAGTSNKALAQLAPKVQWVHSYVTADRTFCIYLAEDESQVHEHARISGFPATRVYEVLTMIDPTTERRDKLAQVA